MVTHSSILAWRIPWTKKPGGLQSMVLQRVRHDLATKHSTAQLRELDPTPQLRVHMQRRVRMSQLRVCRWQLKISCAATKTRCSQMLFSHQVVSDSLWPHGLLQVSPCPSLPFIISQSLLRLMSIESVMLSNHLKSIHEILWNILHIIHTLWYPGLQVCPFLTERLFVLFGSVSIGSPSFPWASIDTLIWAFSNSIISFLRCGDQNCIQ